MSKVSNGCCCSHYHIIRKVSNTLAGSALPLPPLTRSGRSSDSFQPTDYHKNLVGGGWALDYAVLMPFAMLGSQPARRERR